MSCIVCCYHAQVFLGSRDTDAHPSVLWRHVKIARIRVDASGSDDEYMFNVTIDVEHWYHKVSCSLEPQGRFAKA